MGVTGEMEEQVPFRLFQLYIRYHSPRPNLLTMESINLSLAMITTKSCDSVPLHKIDCFPKLARFRPKLEIVKSIKSVSDAL